MVARHHIARLANEHFAPIDRNMNHSSLSRLTPVRVCPARPLCKPILIGAKVRTDWNTAETARQLTDGCRGARTDRVVLPRSAKKRGGPGGPRSGKRFRSEPLGLAFLTCRHVQFAAGDAAAVVAGVGAQE